MSHPFFDLLNLLDREQLHYRLDRYRPDTVIVIVTVVGERLEVDVFENGHMEYSRFKGDESVEGGTNQVMEILKRYGRERDMA